GRLHGPRGTGTHPHGPPGRTRTARLPGRRGGLGLRRAAVAVPSLVHDTDLRSRFVALVALVALGHASALVRSAFVRPALIWIFFGLALSILGTSTVRTPSSKRASTLDVSTCGGSVTVRANAPCL